MTQVADVAPGPVLEKYSYYLLGFRMVMDGRRAKICNTKWKEKGTFYTKNCKCTCEILNIE
jgi:hypothetical protein